MKHSTKTKLMVFITGILSCMLLVSFAACKISEESDETNDYFKEYNMYLVYAASEDITPLDYETWLATVKGEKGDKGDKGEDGKDGANGKSAYEIWLENGHTGSQTDFLEWLKGEKGDKGEAGKDGTNGTNGTNGTDGKDGRGIEKITYKDGTLTIIYTDGTGETIILQNESEGTEGLEYSLLSDDTYGVKGGTALYLNKVTIPATYKGKAVTQILEHAFENSTNLKEIQLPDSIEKIQSYAFNGCKALENITIPSSVKFIGEYAFYGIKNATFEDEEAWKNVVKPRSVYKFNVFINNSGYPDSSHELYAVDSFSLVKLLSDRVNVQVSSYDQMFLESGCKNEYKNLTLYEYSYSK